jgi:glutaredoxin
MLEDAGFEVDDQLLTSRNQVEQFKEKHGVATTPLVIIDGKPVGGSNELAHFLETGPQGELAEERDQVR